MSKTFRDWEPDQVWLLPPSLQDLVPAGHVAHFVRDTVREELDLSAIFSAYDEERGYPPYHPTMMVALLLYAYSRGLYSSRRIAQACEERVDFMAVTAMNQPDFRTIAKFRRRHLKALSEVSADAGYCDEQNLQHLARRRINGYIAPGRARHGEKHAAGSRRWPKGSRKAAMATKLKRAGRRSRYRLRKQIVEPVFGQIKQARGFRQFLLRGLNKVRGEWAMVCTVHNLLKLAKATG